MEYMMTSRMYSMWCGHHVDDHLICANKLSSTSVIFLEVRPQIGPVTCKQCTIMNDDCPKIISLTRSRAKKALMATPLEEVPSLISNLGRPRRLYLLSPSLAKSSSLSHKWVESACKVSPPNYEFVLRTDIRTDNLAWRNILVAWKSISKLKLYFFLIIFSTATTT